MLDSMTFHHIGLAVRSIDLTAAIYVNAGYKQSVTIFDPVHKGKYANSGTFSTS